MCGIAGFFGPPSKQTDEMQQIVKRMADRLIHRGPDDSGAWVDSSAGVALGFRRLAIVDLSGEGHQPMLSVDGRLVMIFNGEVYNFQELRKELEPKGYRFRGHSDTEVILAAVSEWGIEQAVKRFVGMFAFALWDRRERRLHLVRDRLGVKPLYYGWAGSTLLFSSELKSFLAHPDFQPQIERDAIALQLRFSYIPAPYSIYAGVAKLGAGCILTATADGQRGIELGQQKPYWSARQLTEQACAEPLAASEDEAIARLEELLIESVRLRMIADVPLGAFLSGGIDSSLVVALMQRQSSRPVRTFTIGFREQQYDEAPYAKAVAKHLGTEHTEMYVTPMDSLAVIPKLPALYDEPFSDSSQIPTYLVSALTRQYVTVSLSGDGGDELFGGYNRYFWGASIWKQVGWIPRPLRRSAARAFQRVPPATWDSLSKALTPVIPRRWSFQQVGDKVEKLARLLGVANSDELYQALISHWMDQEIVIGSGRASTSPIAASEIPSLPNFQQRMMFQDLVSYLPDDILVKVDRATMAVGLEGREPLLDHRVVEFAARVPLRMKIRNGKGKWLLRQVLTRYVPDNLVERPKMGFGLPIDGWLRGPLREWAEDLLSESRLKREGYLAPAPIRRMWSQHLSGNRNWQYFLWDVLMFQAWRESWHG